MLLPEDAADDLKEFQSRLDALGTDVEAMLAALSPSAPNLLSPLKRAEALVALAHAVHALNMLHTWCAMGKDPTQVPAVHKEQERLDAYKKKVAKAVAADDLSKARKTVDLNVDAANRFISAAIPDLTDEQRAALRAGNAAGRKRAAAEAAAAAAAETGRTTRQRTGPGAGQGAGTAAAGGSPSAWTAKDRGGKGRGNKGGRAAAAASAKDHAVQFLEHMMQQDLSKKVGTLEHMQGDAAGGEEDVGGSAQ